MTKNFWERDRKTIYKSLVKEYQKEGYSQKEARKFASQETREIMSDKEYFVKGLLDLEEEKSN